MIRYCHSHVKRLASQADVILYFAGEEAILSGEAHCLSSISLQGGQNGLHQLLKNTGKPVVCSIMAGPALTDLIFGDASPSGRLPVTFPVDEGQIPIYYNHNSTGRHSDKCFPDIIGKQVLLSG